MAKPKFIGSNQQRGFRQVNTLSITQDLQQFTVDLPRGPHIESCTIRIAGTANITTAFASVRAEGAARFLRRLDWVLNSNVTMDSVSGHQMLAQMILTRPQRPTNLNPAGFGISAQPFVAVFVVDRAIMDMMRPKDSMLKTDTGVSNNQLRLQFGALSDMFTGGGVASYTNVSCSVSVNDYQEARDGDGNTPSPSWYAKRSGNFVTIPGAVQAQQIKINTGNRLRILSLRVLDAVTLEPNFALLTRLRLQRAGDTRADMTPLDMLAINQSAYPQALMAGQVAIDFARTGQTSGCRYSEFWPIPTSADTFLLVDTSAACVIETSTLEGVDLVNQ